jgi:hypothetical protein
MRHFLFLDYSDQHSFQAEPNKSFTGSDVNLEEELPINEKNDYNPYQQITETLNKPSIEFTNSDYNFNSPDDKSLNDSHSFSTKIFNSLPMLNKSYFDQPKDSINMNPFNNNSNNTTTYITPTTPSTASTTTDFNTKSIETYQAQLLPALNFYNSTSSTPNTISTNGNSIFNETNVRTGQYCGYTLTSPQNSNSALTHRQTIAVPTNNAAINTQLRLNRSFQAATTQLQPLPQLQIANVTNQSYYSHLISPNPKLNDYYLSDSSTDDIYNQITNQNSLNSLNKLNPDASNGLNYDFGSYQVRNSSNASSNSNKMMRNEFQKNALKSPTSYSSFVSRNSGDFSAGVSSTFMPPYIKFKKPPSYEESLRKMVNILIYFVFFFFF